VGTSSSGERRGREAGAAVCRSVARGVREVCVGLIGVEGASRSEANAYVYRRWRGEELEWLSVCRHWVAAEPKASSRRRRRAATGCGGLLCNADLGCSRGPACARGLRRLAATGLWAVANGPVRRMWM
jgi:hypothetical protein